MLRNALILSILCCALGASPAAAFRHLAPGTKVDNPALLTVDGLVEPLLAGCGAPTVVLFWATWSPRSAEALADLQQLYAQSGVAVTVIDAESQSSGEEGMPAARRVARDSQFPVFVDRGLNLMRAWGAVAVPSLALVDGDGIVLRILDGYPPGERRAFLQEAAAVGSCADLRASLDRAQLAD